MANYQFGVIIEVEQVVRDFYNDLLLFLVTGQQPTARGENFEFILPEAQGQDLRLSVKASNGVWLALYADARQRDSQGRKPLVSVDEGVETIDLNTGHVVPPPSLL